MALVYMYVGVYNYYQSLRADRTIVRVTTVQPTTVSIEETHIPFSGITRDIV